MPVVVVDERPRLGALGHFTCFTYAYGKVERGDMTCAAAEMRWVEAFLHRPSLWHTKIKCVHTYRLQYHAILFSSIPSPLASILALSRSKIPISIKTAVCRRPKSTIFGFTVCATIPVPLLLFLFFSPHRVTPADRCISSNREI